MDPSLSVSSRPWTVPSAPMLGGRPRADLVRVASGHRDCDSGRDGHGRSRRYYDCVLQLT